MSSAEMNRTSNSANKTMLLFLVLIGIVFAEYVPKPTEDYPFSLVLSRDHYTVFWKHEPDTVTLEIHATTRGWVGIGFSPHGGMKGADIALAWISDDGTAFLEDRHALSEGEPIRDEKQDWNLISATETHASTIIKMSRLKNTGDPNDSCLSDETVRLIWAYHLEDPQQGEDPGELHFPYHGLMRRGSRSVWLISHASKKPEMPDGAFTIDLFNPKVTIPDSEMAYWCQGIRLPKLNEKHHVIKFEAVVEKGHEPLVHHMLLYACTFPVNDTFDGVGDFCYQKNKAEVISACTGTIFGWPTGGNDFELPEHVGYPIGPGYPDFYRLETHFNFPNKYAGQTDSSGIRLWVTKDLRQWDAGLIESGVMPHMFHLIPPGDLGFQSLGVCSTACLEQAMEAADLETGMNFFAAELHSHLSGITVRVHHVRNSTVIGIIARDNHFDFNFQEMREFKEEIVIKPGDSFITECIYNTSARTELTKGGLSTMDEMCLVHMWYYPKINLSNCASLPSPDQTAKAVFGSNARAVPLERDSLDWRLVSPKKYRGKSLMRTLHGVEWTDELRQQFEKEINRGRHLARCDMGSVIYPAGFRFFDFPDVKDQLTTGDDMCRTMPNASNRPRRDASDWAAAGAMGALDMTHVFSKNNEDSSAHSLHNNLHICKLIIPFVYNGIWMFVLR